MSSGPPGNVKLVLVGDMYVGKTSLVNVFVRDEFRDTYRPGVGGSFFTKTLEAPKTTLQIWDTAGMERFRALLPFYMRNARCAIIVYDVANRESFFSVRDHWIDYVETTGFEVTVKVLVANKSDSQIRAVNEHEGRRLALSHNMLFFETSAKCRSNVDEMFTEAALGTWLNPDWLADCVLCNIYLGKRRLPSESNGKLLQCLENHRTAESDCYDLKRLQL